MLDFELNEKRAFLVDSAFTSSMNMIYVYYYFMKPKVHYRFHISLPLATVFS
jgi:hypothetical protein